VAEEVRDEAAVGLVGFEECRRVSMPDRYFFNSSKVRGQSR
jgi:hypothetical protein